MSFFFLSSPHAGAQLFSTAEKIQGQAAKFAPKSYHLHRSHDSHRFRSRHERYPSGSPHGRSQLLSWGQWYSHKTSSSAICSHKKAPRYLLLLSQVGLVLFVSPSRAGPIVQSSFLFHLLGVIVLNMRQERLPQRVLRRRLSQKDSQKDKLRKDVKTHRIRATRTQLRVHAAHQHPEQAHHNLPTPSTILLHGQIFPHNQESNYYRYLHANKFSNQGTTFFFSVALRCHCLFLHL